MTVACFCEDGHQGTKTCLPEGDSWSECDCDCERQCVGRVCGEDGCGGSCGTCGSEQRCEDGQCVCLHAACRDRCCAEGEVCFDSACCLPDCSGKECGTDGCGDECPPGCGEEEICDPQTWTCTVCVPDCEGRECGPDSCGGTCPPGCNAGFLCRQGQCEACEPDCENKECGPDGCGGECPPGCGEGQWCSQTGTCSAPEDREWITVISGAFTMGSPLEEPGRFDSEVQHEVSLSRDFEMLATEVCQGDFEAVMGYNPSSQLECGLECPANNVTWHEAAAYTNALSVMNELEPCYECTGSGEETRCELLASLSSPYACPGYRLPTEAEWEYAARGGTSTSTYNGTIDQDHLECESPNPVLDPIAWFCGNASMRLRPCGQKEPNAFGLYDMLGSTLEWCQDWHADYPDGPAPDPWGPISGTDKVRRGGSFLDKARDARSARKRRLRPELSSLNDGVRPVRTLP
ncbi:MAG: formylglycine-generating enzyme family protein [Deltaproteobacteria bacterium]|nr:formylglycine-generating enzyme family protein [Deltaproteobacteria bacterium]